MIKQLLKRNYTKWIPIMIYDYCGNKYLLQGRRNLKSGKIEFTNYRLNGLFNLLHQMPENNLDSKVQLELLTNTPTSSGTREGDGC